MRKLYIVPPQSGEEAGVYQLVTQDGLGLASHECLHSIFAKQDLITNRPDRLKAWANYLEGGYEIEFATETQHNALFSLNQRSFNDPKNRAMYMREVMKMDEEDIAFMVPLSSKMQTYSRNDDIHHEMPRVYTEVTHRGFLIEICVDGKCYKNTYDVDEGGSHSRLVG